MNIDSDKWDPIATAPLDGTYLHLRGWYGSTSSIVEVIGYYDLGGHTEGWCDERGVWFIPTEWRAMNTPRLESVDDRYQDLLNQLGVQNHTEALNKINRLMYLSNIKTETNQVSSKNDIIKIIFMNNINLKNPIMGFNEDKTPILFNLPKGWEWQFHSSEIGYVIKSDNNECVTSEDIINYANSLLASYNKLNPGFPKSKLVAETELRNPIFTLINTIKEIGKEEFSIPEIIPKSTYKEGMQMLPPVYMLNSFIDELKKVVEKFNSSNISMPSDNAAVLEYFYNQDDVNSKTIQIADGMSDLIQLINKIIDEG